MKTVTFTDDELIAVTMACYAQRAALREQVQSSQQQHHADNAIFRQDLKDLTEATCKLNQMDLI